MLEQDFNKLNSLIEEGMHQFQNKSLNLKLWFRFWKALEMYDGNSTYKEVLQALFGAKSTENVKTHKKVKDFNTALKYL